MFLLVSSGRELFMADASVFVDDAEAYEVYEREEEPEANEESVHYLPSMIFVPFLLGMVNTLIGY